MQKIIIAKYITQLKTPAGGKKINLPEFLVYHVNSAGNAWTAHRRNGDAFYRIHGRCACNFKSVTPDGGPPIFFCCIGANYFNSHPRVGGDSKKAQNFTMLLVHFRCKRRLILRYIRRRGCFYPDFGTKSLKKLRRSPGKICVAAIGAAAFQKSSGSPVSIRPVRPITSIRFR